LSTGEDKVNPMAMILATGEALRWLGGRKENTGLTRAGDAVENAVKSVLSAGGPLTYDLVGEERAAPMSAVATAILRELPRLLAAG
jgi:3-isopropylmalate dehydrogenase